MRDGESPPGMTKDGIGFKWLLLSALHVNAGFAIAKALAAPV